MMKRAFLWLGAVAALASFAANVFVAQPAMALDFALPPAPALERPIVDQTGTLSTAEIDKLSEEIAAFRQAKDVQIGVLMIPTIGIRSLEDYSLSVARAWGIGDKQRDSGVLLVIAKDDRKLRIEVGSGQEGGLTDARAGRIIRNVIAPEFAKENWAAGISAGVAEIAAAIEGVPESTTGEPEANWAEMAFGVAAIGFIMVEWLASLFARSKSWWAGGVVGGVIGGVVVFLAGAAFWSVALLIVLAAGGLLLDYVVSKNYASHRKRGDSPSWWAGGGWFGGGSGSGSGGSFGGGGFSGGGASGSW